MNLDELQASVLGAEPHPDPRIAKVIELVFSLARENEALRKRDPREQVHEADLDGRCENCGALIGFGGTHTTPLCVDSLKTRLAKRERAMQQILPAIRRGQAANPTYGSLAAWSVCLERALQDE